MYLAELTRMASDPAPIGVVGVGRMGRGIGAQVADLAIARGRHTVLLNVEADIVVGPILAHRAHENGVVYTLAAGDQPGAIFELVEWARCLGFEIVCAGRGTVLFPDDHHATPETYAEI